MNNSYSVIYNTCDKYDSLWPGFFKLFVKYWPECTSKIIINTEEKSISYDSLNIQRPQKSGTGISWSQRLINSLDSIDTPFVVTILDDFWFKSKVDDKSFNECLGRMKNDPTIKCYTFAWQPGPNHPDRIQKDFEIRGRFARYRINAQIALWRVEYLRKILRTYENPWQFELSGSFRSSIYGGKILSLKKNSPLVFDYDFGFLVIRGRLNRQVADYFSKIEGIEMNFPFEDFDGSSQTAVDSRSARFIHYFLDMVVSLFRK